MLSWNEIQARAVAFSKRWRDAHNEEAQAQTFELELCCFYRVLNTSLVGI